MQDVTYSMAGVPRNIVTQTNQFAEILTSHLPNISGTLLLNLSASYARDTWFVSLSEDLLQ
jgi:hypothetical protein